MKIRRESGEGPGRAAAASKFRLRLPSWVHHVGLRLLWLAFLGIALTGGYRLVNHDLPIAHGDFADAAQYDYGDRAQAFYSAALSDCEQGHADAAPAVLDQAYDACKDDQDEIRPDCLAMASRIKMMQGNLAAEKGDFGGAFTAYQSALKAQPTNMGVKYNYEMLLSLLKGQGNGKPKIVPGSSDENPGGI
jgi:tetratricopeptide (TPR) repeat protein